MKVTQLSSLAASALVTLCLSGCGGDDTASAANLTVTTDSNSLSTFLTLHKQFCEKDFDNRESLVQALEADDRFQPAKEFIGVYETTVDGVSYAISPEVDGCTTDVMVQNSDTGDLLFSYEQLNSALINQGYRTIGNATKRKDFGSDQLAVNILERTFMSPAGETTNLDFPEDRPDKYYMTLFAKKFITASNPAALTLNKQ